VIETAELWNSTYPNKSFSPYNILAGSYLQLGQPEKAIEPANQAIRLSPNWAGPYLVLARALIRLNRFAEAKEVYERAIAGNLDSRQMRRGLYDIAFISGDAAGMQRQLDWTRGQPDRGSYWQADTAAFAGQWHRAHELSRNVVNVAASVLYPLAHLGLARAAAMSGDTAKARQAYQDFFALWKDADADLPALIEGKKEYEKLK
jgi:tetratricopeptide (TPR) repeat protein